MQDYRTPDLLIIAKEEFKEKLWKRISDGTILSARPVAGIDTFDQAEKNFRKWDNYNYEFLKLSFNNEDNIYKRLYSSKNDYLEAENKERLLQYKFDNKLDYLKELHEQVDLLKTDFEVKTTSPKSIDRTISKNIFIVHGHNTEIKLEVARTLERVGLNPIILHEQPNMGKTLLEKFESNSNVGFAVILLTNDDLGKANVDTDLKERARQNVILELGYFMGKLGRNHILALHTHGVELPNDILGLAYTQIDVAGHWKSEMIRELKSVGYDIDANKLYKF